MLRFLQAVTPSPSPSLPFDENLVTPGVVGFFVTLGVILATIVIIIDMNRRTRRVRYRAEIAARLDAEEAALAEEHPESDERS